MEEDIIFEYPSAEQSATVTQEYAAARCIKTKLSSYVLLGIVLMLVLLTATFIAGKHQMLFFILFVIALFLTFLFARFAGYAKVTSLIFLTAYNDRMEIVKYDDELLGREEAVVYYDDIIRGRFTSKDNTQLKISFFETERTGKIAISSKGQQMFPKTSNTMLLSFGEGSELQFFFTEIAPTLFDISFKNRKDD